MHSLVLISTYGNEVEEEEEVFELKGLDVVQTNFFRKEDCRMFDRPYDRDFPLFFSKVEFIHFKFRHIQILS